MQFALINPLRYEFYSRTDVVQIANDLLGKVLYTSFHGKLTAGIIIETEAYAGATDKASHAFSNRRTARTEIMFCKGGSAYVYLCYGIHSLFNIVTSVEDDPCVVLIRGIEPLCGIDIMTERKGRILTHKDGVGPGNVSKLLGIRVEHSGLNLYNDLNSGMEIWIQDEGIQVIETEVKSSPRIGIAYAGNDAFLPYRFQWIKK